MVNYRPESKHKIDLINYSVGYFLPIYHTSHTYIAYRGKSIRYRIFNIPRNLITIFRNLRNALLFLRIPIWISYRNPTDTSQLI